MAKKKQPWECAYFEIKNFADFQHYSKRNPPWIRLYRSILDDPEFVDLDEVSRWRYMGLTLVASMSDNRIKNDPSYLQKMLRLDHKPDLTPLFKSGFLLAKEYSSASKRIAKSYPNALSEQSITETDNSEQSRAEQALDKPKKIMTGWPEDFQMTDAMRAYAKEHGIENPDDEFEYWHDKALARGYKNVDWVRAWQTWCRSPYQASKQKPEIEFYNPTLEASHEQA